MKKLLILVLTSLFALTSIPVQANTFARSSGTEIGPIIIITLIFGRPKKNCAGFGVCDFSIDWGIERRVPSNSGSGKAWIENGKLHLELNRTSIEPGTFDTYFSAGSFRMEEEFTLSDEAAAALGVSSYTIKAGNYAVSSESGSNTLSLTL